MVRLGKFYEKEYGFTLVELMITMMISAVIIGAIYSAYTVQQKTYTIQDQVAEMQQNIRGALDLVTREVRMAGLDPMSSAGAGITLAKRGRLSFTLDRTNDGDINISNEEISFGFKEADDADDDGIPDSGAPATFGRQAGGEGYQPIAENIQAIEFNYILADGSTTTTPGVGQYKKIRSVQVTLLARARSQDTKFEDTMTYTTASGATWGPYNDHYRRRLLVATIQCRNLGM